MGYENDVFRNSIKGTVESSSANDGRLCFDLLLFKVTDCDEIIPALVKPLDMSAQENVSKVEGIYGIGNNYQNCEQKIDPSTVIQR